MKIRGFERWFPAPACRHPSRARAGSVRGGSALHRQFESICLSDLQYSKQLLVLGPGPSGVNINGDISADAVHIVRKARQENAPAVSALVERAIRNWERRSDDVV